MVKYFQGGYDEAKLYTKSSGKKIYPICPDCGKIKGKAISICDIYFSHSIWCTCGDGLSYPNKIGFALLEQLEIDFKTEYSPDWCKYEFKDKLRHGKYDFYFELENRKYIIEMDGGFHSNDNKMTGQRKEESKNIDCYKDELAKEYGIDVIRIDCDKSELDYIKNNVINSNLSKLFDLSKIEWEKCEEFALRNLVKKACDLWDEKTNNIMQISIILKLSSGTIRKYLNQGSRLRWCKYDGKKEMKKANSKRVEVFKDDISLGVFESCVEVEKQSESLFRITLNSSWISQVCLGRQKHHKGFTFKHI
jgi:very-short-patch-repair endonuclease